MKKSSNDEIRRKIAGLGKSSIRKNYYNELSKKQIALEEKNKDLEKEIILRIKAEEALKEINNDLEYLVKERTNELEIANEKLLSSYEKLKQTQDYLVESEKMASLATLVIGISHELNTPLGTSLTAVSYCNSMINKIMNQFDLESDKQLKDMIEKLAKSNVLVLDNINRSIRLVEDFKRITSDQKKYKLVEFNVFEYIDILIKSLSHGFDDDKNIKFNTNIEANLCIYSFPGILTQIISNFISNSMIHGFEGAKEGNISIDIFDSEDSYYIRYSDDGKGIDKDILGNIYDPFFTTRRSKTSSGMGLYSVYNLVKRLKGTISVKSENNKGLTFELQFPKIEK